MITSRYNWSRRRTAWCLAVALSAMSAIMGGLWAVAGDAAADTADPQGLAWKRPNVQDQDSADAMSAYPFTSELFTGTSREAGLSDGQTGNASNFGTAEYAQNWPLDETSLAATGNADEAGYESGLPPVIEPSQFRRSPLLEPQDEMVSPDGNALGAPPQTTVPPEADFDAGQSPVEPTASPYTDTQLESESLPEASGDQLAAAGDRKPGRTHPTGPADRGTR